MNFKIIMECITGSKLYGTNTKDSDTDIRGIFLQDPKEFNLLPETITLEDSDTVYHSLRKFFTLCAQNNPNIIEMLFVPEHLIIKKDHIWDKIKLYKYIFPSKKCANRFIGYAREQLKRIQTHRSWLLNPPKDAPKRKDFGLDEKKLISSDQMGAFNVILKQYLDEVYEFHELKDIIYKHIGEPDFLGIVQSIGHKLNTDTISKLTDLNPNFITIVQKEKNYQNAMNYWKQYNKWKKERNPERAVLEKLYGYDCKHAQHIFRLIGEGIELLTTGKITFPRPDAEFLLDIKNGKLSYQELMNLVNEDIIKQQINKAKELSNLPEECDIQKVSKLYDKCLNIFLN